MSMMKKEMENGKSVFFVLSDNSPDFNPVSHLNTLFYYRPFHYLQMDMLCVSTYAARYSYCIQPYQTLVVPLVSNALLESFYFCVFLPPAKKSTKSLSPVEWEQKEAIVFNNAMQSCTDHWKDLTFDGFPVNATVVKCNELKFKDYETIKEFLSCLDSHKLTTQERIR